MAGENAKVYKGQDPDTLYVGDGGQISFLGSRGAASAITFKMSGTSLIVTNMPTASGAAGVLYSNSGALTVSS